jgi:hypothetical protein
MPVMVAQKNTVQTQVEIELSAFFTVGLAAIPSQLN